MEAEWKTAGRRQGPSPLGSHGQLAGGRRGNFAPGNASPAFPSFGPAPRPFSSPLLLPPPLALSSPVIISPPYSHPI